MIHGSLDDFARARGLDLGRGAVALVIAEDATEIGSTVAHLIGLGFARVVLVAPDGLADPGQFGEAAERMIFVRHATRTPGTAMKAVNALIAQAPGRWLHYCFNGEYLFYPFCESRSIGEATAFVEEERRYSILTYVIDLYAADLNAHPNAVALDTAYLDRSGYYAEARPDMNGHPRERQLNFYGGLRWRFEEHVAPPKRKIDRVGLFRARPGLTLREDHTLSDEEMNTYACPWHHSMTAAICSFRVAKALRTNPGSRHDVQGFLWHRSTRFRWSSQQLMELGLIEPGQWF
ncbi:hypothetical protein HKCCE3408_00655 [Rhodobacterales bacterium HKCCE3408]|nr:hypothetical protein [Rhodobacterales bacterium HKCCE3408]